MKYVDSHIHLNDYTRKDLLRYCGRHDLELITVSEDLKSSLTNISLMEKCQNVQAAVGVHPWMVGKISLEELSEVIKLIDRVRFVGEVGLDKRFVPGTFRTQVEVFVNIIKETESRGKGLLLHAVGAWEEVLNLVAKSSVGVAVLHWYTGPTDLIKYVKDLGYYIGVNAALLRQAKAREVVRQAPLELLLTESDGPYEYRGLRLGPDLIPSLVGEIAVIKGVNPRDVMQGVYNNYTELLRRVR
ncbi:MAG: TatD family hydrolase [Zestosphaera sp.]